MHRYADVKKYRRKRTLFKRVVKSAVNCVRSRNSGRAITHRIKKWGHFNEKSSFYKFTRLIASSSASDGQQPNAKEE